MRSRAWNTLANLWRVLLSPERIAQQLEVEELREQLDHLKSRLEVPAEWLEDLRTWRESTPLPATPLVTVCVPTYNRPRLLTERCIASVLGQTYRNLELIVVGDAAASDTVEAVSRVEDPRLRFVNLPERGRYPSDPHLRWMVAGAAPANKALELSSGDLVTHLDDDDAYEPERLERLVEFMVQSNCDLAWHPFWHQDLRDRWRINPAQRFTLGQVTNSSVFYRSWFTRIRYDIQAYLLREPGDWNRFRRIRYVGARMLRYPHPLTRHFREHTATP